MRLSARITYAAVGSALALVALLSTLVMPARLTPLGICVLAYVIIGARAGVLSSVASMVAVSVLSLVVMGVGMMTALHLVLGVPYALSCCQLRRLDYSTRKMALVRAGVACFVGLCAGVMLLLMWDVVIAQLGVLRSLPAAAVFLTVPVVCVGMVGVDYMMVLLYRQIISRLDKREQK